MPESLISTALSGVRTRISEAESERAHLERIIAAAREEEGLLMRLLALRRGADAIADGAAHGGQAGATDEVGSTGVGKGAKHPVVEAVVRELALAGRPLHISDLMRLLREGQVEIPGAGGQANLITHLRRDSRIVRPSRGMYALTAWGLENMPTMTRRKRRRSRVRSAKATRSSTT